MRNHTADIELGAGARLLIGNPNVGKSAVFSFLTGGYATVSNYPGTTVELLRGRLRGKPVDIIDTPGINTLACESEDEKVARDAILGSLQADDPRVILVADAKNLRRGLLLALQIAELEIPMVMVLNMIDEADADGYRIDLEALSQAFGCPVVSSVATRGQGLDACLADTLSYETSRACASYEPWLEATVQQVADLLPATQRGRRGLATLFLSTDASLEGSLARYFGGNLERARAIRRRLRTALGGAPAHRFAQARIDFAESVEARCTSRRPATESRALRRFGELAMHPVWGLPVALGVLYLTYLFVGQLGAGTAVDFLENTIFGERVIPWLDGALRTALPSPAERFLLGETPGSGPGLLIGDYGVLSMALTYAVAIILPVVSFFFVAFAIMEDSGYLPRLAVVLHRTFQTIGLNGKAVLPMILGLGCDTMATMTARIMPTKKERVMVTLLLALGVPCSAQLGVILAMLAGLSGWATLVWLASVALVVLAVGYLASKILPGETSAFVMEVPPIRRPSLKNVAMKTIVRVEWYLKEAVPLFVVGTLLLWILDRAGALQAAQQWAAPVVVRLLDLPAQASDAFLIGFLRRDYGAAGLFALFERNIAAGLPAVETQIQVVVAMVTITLFMPCLANLLVIVKEHGLKIAAGMVLFIFPLAFGAGAVLNAVLRAVML